MQTPPGFANASSRAMVTMLPSLNVVGVNDGKINPDAETEPRILNCISIAPDYGLLHLDRTADRLHRTEELDEHALACGFNNPTVIFSYLWVDELTAIRL